MPSAALPIYTHDCGEKAVRFNSHLLIGLTVGLLWLGEEAT